MIQIFDNFLKEAAFSDLQQYTNVNEFEIVTVGDKNFSVLNTPPWLYEFLQVPGHELILTFIRSAWKEFDNDARIHCDHTINGRKSDMASVLYINEIGDCSPNGTAFFSHHKHGYKAPDNLSEEEFNKMLTEDANDPSKWESLDYISARPNRMLVYPSAYFHAKEPAVIEQGTRKVLVCFWSKKGV